MSAVLVKTAFTTPLRVKTVSFEVADPSIEATVHDGAPGLLRFHPGDPWVTGYAQVGVASDQSLVGLFDFTYWHKYPDGVIAENIYSTGLLGDDQMPPLKYGGTPDSWPPLPDNWK